ncbi:hypothetical protein MMC25_001553 [Agyrium rufum]|nr:hypothetical protein [Agyrium rufum]
MSTTATMELDVQQVNIRPDDAPYSTFELNEIAPPAHTKPWQADSPNHPSPPSLRQKPSSLSELPTREPATLATGAQSPTNGASNIVEQAASFWHPHMNRYRVIACCFLCFGNGFNDSVPGALLPYIETHYNIGYAAVSTIFVGNALGFIASAFFANSLTQRLGRAKTLMIATALMVAGYVTIATAPPFPLVVIAFFLCGVGMSINLAIGQVFILNLQNNTYLSGIYQGSYAAGATLGPLIATTVVTHGVQWQRFYLLNLGITVFNFGFCAWSFSSYEKDTPNQTLPILEAPSSSSRSRTDEGRQENRERAAARDYGAKQGRWQSFKTLVGNRPTILGALFIFAYQGAEVSISGWVISFLVKYRNGNLDRVGYVTSGFWAGITIGRLTLSHIAHVLGARGFIFAAVLSALVFELIIWFVPSIPGDSVAIGLSGLMLGPIYPIASFVLARLIPRKMQMSSFSFIASIGSSGGAVAPLITGLMAGQYGTFVLHPICIALFVAMQGCWFMLPKVGRRVE